MSAFCLKSMACAAGVAAMLLIAGCSPAGNSGGPAPKSGDERQGPSTAKNDAGDDKHDHETAGHDHSGWWCAEHGIPEEECALCNSKVAAEFKRKGDWCKKHDRPDSQCFICHPEYEAKFAARYEAKYGTKPPPREPDAEEGSSDEG